MRRFNKRGILGLDMFTLIEMILLLTFITFSVMLTNDYKESTTFEKSYLVRYLGSLEDTILIPSGEVEIQVPIETKKFSFMFNRDNVEAYEDRTLGKVQSYTFTNDKKVSVDVKKFEYIEDKTGEDSSVRIKMCKLKDKIKFGDCL